ncbi:MAG: hypothetical protein GF313_07230 [Caldithrix sp.]|nr:hypothetical protein [Caldithrix sp.]
MIRKFTIAVVLLLIYFTITTLYPNPEKSGNDITLLLGIMIMAAYLIALILRNVKLPKLSGYMILGLILGPIGFNFLSENFINQINFITHLALSFIALTAGGEFKFKRIKQIKNSMLAILVGQVVFVFIGLFLLLYFVSSIIPFLADLNNEIMIGFSILFAVTALSTSPAVTMGIITEFKAKGRLTDLVLSVTVLKTILLVLMFPIITAWAKVYLLEGHSFSWDTIQSIALQLFNSLLTGTALGFLVIVYLRYIKVEKSIFLLGVAIIIIEMSYMINAEILLTSIITGIIVENFSKEGDALIEGIEQSSLPLYVIFFSVAGASLHLETLKNAILLTVVLVLGRMLFKYIGSYVGALLTAEKFEIKHYTWLGFIGQAGIAVGLATIIYDAIPNETGLQFKTILIGSVVINEMLGPIFFRYGLIKSKEIDAN